VPSTAAIVIKAIDKATGPMRYIQQRYRAMDREQRRIVSSSVRGMGTAGKVLTTLSAGVAAVSLGFRAQTETALGGLASVGIKNLQALEDAGRSFSNQWAVASKAEFLTAAYDIKSGISSLSDQGVADVTRLAGITAQATKATVGQMTSLFATAHGMFKGQFKDLSDSEFAKRFAAGLAATVQGFKTNGPAIQQAIESTKGALSAANVPLAEQLVLLGSLQATMKGAEAGTAAKAFALNVGRAGKALGLPFLNAQKQMRSLPEVLELLRKKYGDTLDAIEKQQIKEAFGSDEALAVIDALWGKEKNFRQELARTNQEMAKGTRHVRMAMVQNIGLAEIWKLLGHWAGNIGDAIGKTLSPAFKALQEPVGKIAMAVQGWIEKNPGWTKAILGVAVGLGILVAALSAGAIAMMAFNAAVWANPITWIVAAVIAGVALLIAGITAMVVYWDEIKAWWSRYWDEWGDVMILALGAVAAIFLGPVGAAAAAVALIINHWGELKQFFAGLWSWISETWRSIDLAEAGRALMLSLWDGLKSVWAGIKDWFKGQIDFLFSWLPDWVKERLGIGSGGVAPGGGAGSAPAATAAPAPAPAGGHSTVDGIIRVELAGAPPGTKITHVSQKGTAGVDVYGGLTMDTPF